VLLSATTLSGAIGALTVAIVQPSAPREPWLHRLACVVPLSAIAGTVLALAAGS
jgi:hypothetical protein